MYSVWDTFKYLSYVALCKSTSSMVTGSKKVKCIFCGVIHACMADFRQERKKELRTFFERPTSWNNEKMKMPKSS